MENCRVCNNKLVFDEKLTYNLGKNEKIYVCKKCKTYFINPEPFSYDDGEEDLLNYYKDRESGTMERLDGIFKKFITINSIGKCALDIGASMGYSGIIAKQFNLDYVGIEPNKILFENAINNFNVNVVNDYFPSDKVSGKFDFIILDNVLEHVYDPKEFFDRVIQWLNPGGVLFLAVPPQDWLRVSLSTNKLIQNAPEAISRRFTMFYDLQQHVNYFSSSSIECLVSNHKNLKIIEQFHRKAWALQIYKLLNITTGQYFIQKDYN
ncbi:class I SAM-dependent methyltransferase [bacterium]|nr:class I SAM-dependent methyltransferase [bacterium]MBU1435298.1 class I SAM-dependent methyltransferase [bacterium]MBU1503496.1 class I SAM-dependent methyltransferase [bacterium]